jgi:hypothetical protein
MDHRPRYCKAFTESELAGFAPFAAARASAASGGVSAAAPILYLHRDLRVRTGAFDDDPVLFETDDPAWARFCSQELSFPPAWIADLAAPGSAASE